MNDDPYAPEGIRPDRADIARHKCEWDLGGAECSNRAEGVFLFGDLPPAWRAFRGTRFYLCTDHATTFVGIVQAGKPEEDFDRWLRVEQAPE